MGEAHFVLNRGHSSTSCRFIITVILKSMGWNIRLDASCECIESPVLIHIILKVTTIHSCGW